MEQVSYAVEMYGEYFRNLMRDIVRQFPDNSEDTVEEEFAYFREGLEKKQVGFLIERIFNKHLFYECLHNQEKNAAGSPKSQSYCRTAVNDFKSEREECKVSENSTDIVWILRASGAKYPSQKIIQINDVNSYDRFQGLLNQLDFSDKGKQLFYNSQENCLWFNGLEDNGRIVYRHEYQDDASLFHNALKKSNLQKMHEKLQELLKLYDKNQKNQKNKREMVAQDMLTVARYLSDLVPIINENSQLKNKEQLQEERMEVRQAVLKKFLMRKDRNREAEGERLKVMLLRYFEDYALAETLIEELCDIKRVSDEQIFVVVGEYLDILWQDMEELKEKVRRYNFSSVLEELQRKRYPIQVYDDMWKEAWFRCPENK